MPSRLKIAGLAQLDQSETTVEPLVMRHSTVAPGSLLKAQAGSSRLAGLAGADRIEGGDGDVVSSS